VKVTHRMAQREVGPSAAHSRRDEAGGQDAGPALHDCSETTLVETLLRDLETGGTSVIAREGLLGSRNQGNPFRSHGGFPI